MLSFSFLTYEIYETCEINCFLKINLVTYESFIIYLEDIHNIKMLDTTHKNLVKHIWYIILMVDICYFNPLKLVVHALLGVSSL